MGILLGQLLNECAASLLGALLLGDLGSESKTCAQSSLDLKSGQAGDVLGE